MVEFPRPREATSLNQPLSQPEAVLHLASWIGGLLAIRSACYGLRLGLLDALHGIDRGLTPTDLARRLHLDPGYVAAWCTAAAGAGLLEHDVSSGRFRLQPTLGDILLDPDNPAYMGGLLLVHDVETRMADRVAGCFSSGEGLAREEYGADLADALAAIARPAYRIVLERVLAAVPPALSEEGKALEIGCGTGTRILALAQAFPGATVTGVEPDSNAVQAADAAIREAGLDDRVSVAQMRGEDLSAADQYDLVYIHNGLEELEDPAAVMSNAYRALRAGGMLLMTRICPAESPAAAPADPLQAFLSYVDTYVHMPRRVAAGRRATAPFSREEIERLVTGAGFAALQELPTDVSLLTILYARKPT